MYMTMHHRGEDDLPLRPAVVAGFVGLLDNAASAMKYITAIKKANAVLNFPELSSGDMNLIKAGMRKFSVQNEKSFLHGPKVDIFVRETYKLGRRDLARFVPVAYTFQLRVQSEGVMLAVADPSELEKGSQGSWHSNVVCNNDGSVTIRLRRRKNKALPSSITRFCICHVWAPRLVCGVCVLRKIVPDHRPGRLFPEIKNTDINVLKTIASSKDLGRVTWHGFRRGRTEDVVAGLDTKANPAASLVEIAEALGHNLRRASFFSIYAWQNGV